MSTYAICSKFLAESVKGDEKYYFRIVLQRFLDKRDAKVAIDKEKKLALAEYKRVQQTSVHGRYELAQWLRLLAANPVKNLEFIPLLPGTASGQMLFASLAASIPGRQALIAWSKAQYVGHTMMANIEVLDRDDAVGELTNDPKIAITIGELTVGDVFAGISDSVIINRSKIVNSFNVVQERDPDAAMAMIELARFVAASNNAAAGAILSAFTSEAAKDKPDKGILQQCWEGLKSILPALGGMAALAANISKLWS